MKQYGIDISHHQNPTALPWKAIADGCSFVICRTSYGLLRDRQVAAHAERVRDFDMKLGIYHFFRPHQPVLEQFEIIRSQAQRAGYGRPGDVVPALDIELDPKSKTDPERPVTTAWADNVRELSELMVKEWGNVMFYITQIDFSNLGRPGWVLERPLWTAHYTARAKPATPGNKPCVIWQHRVAPFVANGPGGFDKANPLLDQNRLLGELPLIAEPVVPEINHPDGSSEDDDGLEDAIGRFVWDQQAHIHDIIDEARHAGLKAES